MESPSELKSSNAVNKSMFIPTNADQLLSATSEAFDCFANQDFSRLLQGYLITYSMNVSGYYSIYK